MTIAQILRISENICTFLLSDSGARPQPVRDPVPIFVTFLYPCMQNGQLIVNKKKLLKKNLDSNFSEFLEKMLNVTLMFTLFIVVASFYPDQLASNKEVKDAQAFRKVDNN